MNDAIGAWKRRTANKSQHPLFWAFIKEDRDLIVKEYKLRAQHGEFIRPPTTRLIRSPDEAGMCTVAFEYTYLITEGHFKGQDPRVIVRNAITWWEEQLDEIEANAAAHFEG